MTLSTKIPLYAAAILALSVAPSTAAVIKNLGTLTASDSQTYGSTATGKFKDYVLFAVEPSNENDLSITITNTYVYSTPGQNIKGLKLSLYEGAYDGSQLDGGGTLLATSSATNTPSQPPPPKGGKPGSNDGMLQYTIDMSSGSSPVDYYIQIAADPGSATNASYGGSISYFVQTIPLPSSLPMFSGALLAIAAGGHVLSRRRPTKSAAA